MNLRPSAPGETARQARGGRQSVYARFFKRPLDILMVVTALPVIAPAIFGISVCILAAGNGPVLLRVSRKGRDGAIFRQLRFRCVDMRALEMPPVQGSAALDAQGRDPRLTVVGEFLIRTRLNALPQVWNVLMGEMSLIGPLPEPVRVDRQIERNATLRRVAPGIFCPSELPAYAHLSGKDRKAVAIAYATRVTFAMDVKVALNAVTSALRSQPPQPPAPPAT
ncbi:sugar transferase [Falsigemmobacter faecalis]|nr:sugar transferase [Falsigemmobacter faecalis]